MGMRGCAWVCAGVRGCAQVCMDMHGCGMYFQNFFWRIESLHQRTLIRILYEFFTKKSHMIEFLQLLCNSHPGKCFAICEDMLPMQCTTTNYG